MSPSRPLSQPRESLAIFELFRHSHDHDGQSPNALVGTDGYALTNFEIRQLPLDNLDFLAVAAFALDCLILIGFDQNTGFLGDGEDVRTLAVFAAHRHGHLVAIHLADHAYEISHSTFAARFAFSRSFPGGQHKDRLLVE